ncbi:hypothetical protein FACS1894211_13980 [Clostridia bacterium]|nr:hypothetical protein FACS1894211_13980 [Clostridia bacterium]
MKQVAALRDYKLDLLYANGEHKIYDFAPLFDRPFNAPLKNPVVFMTARIVGCGVEWCNGIDICPDELYYNSVPA